MTLAEIQRQMQQATTVTEALKVADTIHDEMLDIAIKITNELVKEGAVKDCTDTNDPTEFIVQDTIHRHLMSFVTGGNKQ